MASKNLIRSALTVRGRSGRSNGAASHRGIRLAPLLLVAVMLAVLAETSNPAQTAHAQNYGNVVCSGDCPGYDDVSGEERTIWSTTITAKRSTFTMGTTIQEVIGYDQGLGSIGSSQFTYRGTTYPVASVTISTEYVSGTITKNEVALEVPALLEIAPASRLALELNGRRFLFSAATYAELHYGWDNPGLTWSEDETIAVKLIKLPTPNAYGYRTLWTALMTAETSSGVTGYTGSGSNKRGKLTNDTIVDGRDETITIGTGDQPRFPWTGYVVAAVTNLNGD